MSRWLCNAGYPGTQLADFRVVPDGMEFEVPDNTPAREMWIPLDQAAHDAVELRKLETTETNEREIAEAIAAGEKPPPRRVFKTKPRAVQQKPVSLAGRPDEQEAGEVARGYPNRLT